MMSAKGPKVRQVVVSSWVIGEANSEMESSRQGVYERVLLRSTLVRGRRRKQDWIEEEVGCAVSPGKTSAGLPQGALELG